MSTVLVTGGTGYVASHVILQLLRDGYHVRTTVRSLTKSDTVREMIKKGGVEPGDRLTFVQADLESDSGWKDATSGAKYVLHVASPFPLGDPKDENELIIPAREGTLRVLRNARDAGVKRVVVTSSFAAIGFGHGQKDITMNEEIWSEPSGTDVTAYIKSKLVAEQAAWNFIEKEGKSMELATVNPYMIMGPILGPSVGSSVDVVKKMMIGLPGVPRLFFGIVDVRDLAVLEIKAMTSDAAKGQRFLASNDHMLSMLEIAKILKEHLGPKGKNVTLFQLPDWLVRITACFNADAKSAAPYIGITRKLDISKAERLLGWKTRPTEQTLADTADSLIDFGIVKV
ncbi:uncharacterized protein MJAP1_003479 [Malassezia japonica]|uniref:NAD-dependent epimerase/dehydratase domain-containing protein n=1 Tax=Malassezia japonica TaxID=223818 RepID=A0AAF0F8S4_9BASI|nr:uncharacterized protein MJAP1_003479 [Malassezia japonica]WFD40493.1 hypothetical protein MJAP1_003479 [Malassezia japonica]